MSYFLWDQSVEDGIAGNFSVPPVQGAPPKNQWGVRLWQPNKYQANGLLVTSTQDVSALTGFAPVDPSTAQLGFQNVPGSSTVQVARSTVGAYMNSNDLAVSTADQKFMFSPQINWSPAIAVWSPGRDVLNGEFDLQVPVADGTQNDIYVVMDLLFTDSAGTRVSMGIKLFRVGGDNSTGTSYDAPSNTYMVNSPLGVDGTYVTKTEGPNALAAPWSGFKAFGFTISPAQFGLALAALAAAYPGTITDVNPPDWSLSEIHLNAEFHTQGGFAELGWSMRNLSLWQNF